MKIREKLCTPLGKFYKETSKELEEISDDYAIEFSEWLLKNDLYSEILLKISTSKELLETFKKEKGL